MPFYDSTWYCNAGDQSTTGYYAVAKRPQNTVVVAGQLVRQFTAPAVGSERVFICIIAGTTANITDATWVLTRGAKTIDGTATWQECTGASAINGDLTNTLNWTAARTFSAVPSLGAIIKRNNGASYQICSTSGAILGSEPAFSDIAGVATADGSAVWTSLGPVGNFNGGGAPHARLANVFGVNWFVAGNTVYVGDNHAESQATAISISPPASGATLNKVLCHNHSGSYPPAASDLTTGATIATTAAVGITIGSAGLAYFYGFTFQAGNGATTGTAHITLGASPGGYVFDNCSLQTLDTASGSRILLGGVGATSFIILNNTSVKFGHVGHSFDYGGVGQYVWQNTPSALVTGSAVPSALFNWNSIGSALKLTVEGVDLSACSGTLIAYSNPILGDFVFKDCKFHASATLSGGVQREANVNQFIRCDSGTAAYTSTRYTLEGTETTETSITRVGGAQDASGQAQSRKIVTTTSLSWVLPYRAEPYAIWNPTTGANVTVTVYGTINAGAVPNNDDIWLEIEYLGSSSGPLGTFVSTTKANVLSASAAVASDGSTWNGGGSGAGWSPFKLTATLSSPQPGLAGYLYARVRAAKASVTFYIDPKIVLT